MGVTGKSDQGTHGRQTDRRADPHTGWLTHTEAPPRMAAETGDVERDRERHRLALKGHSLKVPPTIYNREDWQLKQFNANIYVNTNFV